MKICIIDNDFTSQDGQFHINFVCNVNAYRTSTELSYEVVAFDDNLKSGIGTSVSKLEDSIGIFKEIALYYKSVTSLAHLKDAFPEQELSEWWGKQCGNAMAIEILKSVGY